MREAKSPTSPAIMVTKFAGFGSMNPESVRERAAAENCPEESEQLIGAAPKPEVSKTSHKVVSLDHDWKAQLFTGNLLVGMSCHLNGDVRPQPLGSEMCDSHSE
jgi:hypothetical protein